MRTLEAWAVRLGAGVCLAWLMAGCAVNSAVSEARLDIRKLLDQQVKDWNDGDIEAFMKPYWRSPALTFISGDRLTRGWQRTLDSYHERYATPEAMGHLKFDRIQINELGTNAALVLGRWYLRRAEPVGGAFTLVLRRRHGRWEIIHDHTSRAEQ